MPSPPRAQAKYAETLHTFIDKGYSPVFAIDHVGQGTSDRIHEDHSRQHVDSGDQFIEAYGAFLDNVLFTIPADKPRYLACHSMGCAISFTQLIKDHKAGIPSRFNAVVANAPLIKADTAPFPYFIATAIGT